MKRKLSNKLCLIAMGLAALVSGTAQSATTAKGPYYATPSWDQQIATSSRFVILSNWVDGEFPSGGAAVLDRETGLVWQRMPRTSMVSWGTAYINCANTSTGTRFGWRLPSVTELMSLLDPEELSVPPLPAGHPFMGLPTTSALYWTLNSVSDTSARHVQWVSLSPTNLVIETGVFPKSSSLNYWCVRGGGDNTQ